MKVLFTPTGREQFLGALAYIRRDIPVAARAFRLKAEKVLKRLVMFPESGRFLPEFPDLRPFCSVCCTRRWAGQSPLTLRTL